MLPYPSCFSSRTLNDDSGILMIRFFTRFPYATVASKLVVSVMPSDVILSRTLYHLDFIYFPHFCFTFVLFVFFKWFIFGLLVYADNLIHLKTPRRTSKEMGHTMGIPHRTTHRPYPHSLLSWEEIWDPLFILFLLNNIWMVVNREVEVLNSIRVAAGCLWKYFKKIFFLVENNRGN